MRRVWGVVHKLSIQSVISQTIQGDYCDGEGGIGLDAPPDNLSTSRDPTLPDLSAIRLARLRLLRFQDYAKAFLLAIAKPVHSPLSLAAPCFNVGDLVTIPASLCADILRQHGYSIQPDYADRKAWVTRVLPGSRYLVQNLCAAQAINISGRELQRFNPSRAS